MVVHTRDVHHDMKRQRNGFADASVWQADIGGEHAVREPCEGLFGRVRVNGAQTSKVTCVQRLKQVEGLRASHLAHQNSIRPMAKRRAHQVGDRHGREWRFLAKWRLFAARLKPQKVWLLKM